MVWSKSKLQVSFTPLNQNTKEQPSEGHVWSNIGLVTCIAFGTSYMAIWFVWCTPISNELFSLATRACSGWYPRQKIKSFESGFCPSKTLNPVPVPQTCWLVFPVLPLTEIFSPCFSTLQHKETSLIPHTCSWDPICTGVFTLHFGYFCTILV